MLTQIIMYLLMLALNLFGVGFPYKKPLHTSKEYLTTYTFENIADIIKNPRENVGFTLLPVISKNTIEEPDHANLNLTNHKSKLVKENKKSDNDKDKAAVQIIKSNMRKYAVQTAKGSTYHVFGKRYQTLRTSKNYIAKGVASWYGPGFHRKTTSSGERYNMFKMTAAHKTLPLSTYVQVTSLVNGRKIIVKVNDRGPFVGNRLIDLSYAAAKKLGMVGIGIAPVKIQALS